MDEAKQRLFFALWPDAEVRDTLSQWQRMAYALSGGRKMHIDDVHLTLAFLGDTPVSKLPAVREAMNSVEGESFELSVDALRYWRHNKIVWAGASATPPALQKLVGDLRAALKTRAVNFDEKAFVPHITLLRNAKAPDQDILPVPISWTVGRFALVRSAGGEGPRYRVEAERLLGFLKP